MTFSLSIINFVHAQPLQSIDKEKSWYDYIADLGKNYYQKLKLEIDSLKNYDSKISGHKCIWKICSKPLKKHSMKRRIKYNSLKNNGFMLVLTNYRI